MTDSVSSLNRNGQGGGEISRPLISVILPVFNACRIDSHYLIEALESIRNQTYRNFELLIVNDGSTDHSEKICLDFIAQNPDMTIRYHVKENGGQSSARNFGARIARGIYLCFIDQDDLWEKDKLSIKRPFLDSDLDLIYTDADTIDPQGSTVHYDIHRTLGVGSPHPKNSIENILFKDVFVTPGMMAIKRDTFWRVNGFDEALSGYEDDDLFLRIYEVGKMRYFPVSTLKWRMYGGNYSQSPRMVKSRLFYWNKLLKGYTRHGKDIHRLRGITYRFFREFIIQALQQYDSKNEMYLQNLRGARRLCSHFSFLEWITFQSFFLSSRKKTMEKIRRYYEKMDQVVVKEGKLPTFWHEIKLWWNRTLIKSLGRMKDLIHNIGPAWFKDLYLDLTGIRTLRQQVQQLLSYCDELQMRSSQDSRSHLDRDIVARAYLKGNGIEIGALHAPLKLPEHTRVTYIDPKSLQAPMDHSSGHDRALDQVKVDIIGDGETLGFIKETSQDFVIADHLLVHCQNPIAAVQNMLRVLKPKGILYLAIPDQQEAFDGGRPVTLMEHFLRDYEEGPQWSKRQHFQEWVRFVEKVTDERQAEARLSELLEMDYSVHFHVWTQAELLEFFSVLKKTLNFPFQMELAVKNGWEMIFVLKKIEQGDSVSPSKPNHESH